MIVRASDQSRTHHPRPGTRMKGAYLNLLLMGLVHLPFMYAIMFAMVNAFDDVFQNLNMVYMAGMMVVPMMILMPVFMKTMYTNKKLNLTVHVSSSALLLVLYFLIRQQTFISDAQFLRSMIPHHSSAILMCSNARIQDAEIRELCHGIVKSQSSEIDQMKRILNRMQDGK